MKRSLRRALELHDSAAKTLISTVEAIPESQWNEPIGKGKWSSATIVEHLNRTYDIVLAELDGGPGMQVRVSFPMRVLLRLTVVPRILFTGRFPKEAIAPRETRPGASETTDLAEAIDRFRRRAVQLDRAVRGADPRQKLTHAYFGSASVASGVTLCARHIQHHCAQLPAPASDEFVSV